MTRRIAALLTALALVLGMAAFPVCAQAQTEQAELVSAYYRQGGVYAFLKLADSQSADATTAKLTVDGREAGVQLALNSGADAAVEYLLAVDVSKKMPESSYAMLSSLAQGLMQGQSSVSISLGTIGEGFEVTDSRMTSMKQVWAALDKLTFTGETADICAGTVGAIDHVRKSTREPGELGNIILVTNGALEQAANPAAAGVASRIRLSPEVVVHTVSFGQWASDTYDAVTTGTGIHAAAKNKDEAFKQGRAISGWAEDLHYVNCAYDMGMGLEDYLSLQVALDTQGVPTQLMEAEIPNLDFVPAVLDLPVEGDILLPIPGETQPPETVPVELPPADTQPAETDPAGTEPAETSPPETQAPENTPGEAPSEPTDETPGETETGETEPDETGDPEGLDDSEDQVDFGDTEDQEEPGEKELPVWWIAGGVAALLLILVLVILLVRCRRKCAGYEDPGGIPMNIEVLAGTCRTAKRQLKLRDELVIGSDPSCDIIWKDKSVSPRHCRVLLKDNMIWLEDLNETSDTAIEGIRLGAPSRLRSEDEISIGNVRFRLYF